MMTRMVEQVTWSQVVARFAAARNAWFGTVDAAGAPHAVPIWTASVDEVLYVFGERRSVKFRNIAANPRVVVNLESGDEVVILRGSAYDIGTPMDAPEVVAAFAAKYTEPDDVQWLPQVDLSVDLMARIVPSVALLWSSDDYFGTKRRWQAG
jgi:predicted pyridoxine 5'-phosphate oxidase superfamily flavin-nucleotide-binding protein